MIYLKLFLEFCKIGFFTIGGGLASLPYLYELCGKYDWFTTDQITDMIAVAESTPGPIAVNAATFAGYNAAGIPGGILATLGFMFPSLLIILAVSKLLQIYYKKPLVQNAFYGLRPAVTGLIAAACIQLSYKVFLSNVSLSGTAVSLTSDLKYLILFVVAYFAIKKFKLHPIVYIAAGAAIGILLKY